MNLLIDGLGLLRDDSFVGKFQLEAFCPSDHLQLDAAAIKSLHLFPASSSSAKTASLFGLLNECTTSQGSQLLSQWILQPLTSIAAINERLDAVEYFTTRSSTIVDLQQNSLRGVPDLCRILKRCLNVKGATLQDVVKIYEVVCRIPKILETLSDATAAIQAAIVEPLQQLQAELEPFRTLVTSSVDFDAMEYHEYVVRAEFSDVLARLKVDRDAILERISEELNKAADSLNIEAGKKIKLERNPHHGYFLRVSRNDASVVRDRGAEFFELATVKNGIHFTTSNLRILSTQYDAVSKEYQKEQSTLVQDLIVASNAYSNLARRLNSVIAILDVFVALAFVSTSSLIPYCRPEIVDSEQDLILVQSRHPCVEQQQDISFIANDLKLDHSANELLIITGPNMGGKSTFIRQAAVIALMAQFGCFVPCSSAKIPIFDRIMTRVGANDVMRLGISTFMLEMLESAHILAQATSKSLIIVDELGRGTSTHDGFGLAWSIAYELATVTRARVLFATHFHEMTVMSQELGNVKNFHVGAEPADGSIIFHYRLESGACERSFGIHVASLCQFPDVVLQIATQRGLELEA